MIRLACTKLLRGAGADFMLNACFEIKRGDFVALYGKSGAGKTTILRMLAGLESPDSGSIEVGELCYFNSAKRINLAIQKRDIGFVFQDYALFENLNVLSNLLYAKNDPAFAQHLLEILGLDGLSKAMPSTLSGGQKQRVALARALMRKPEILLLDEPLSALDNSTKEHLQNYLLKLHQKLGFTCLLISHDVAEIYKFCSRVLLLENGQIKNLSPKEAFFSTNSSKGLSLYAKVLDLVDDGVTTTAFLLMGQQTFKLLLSKSETKNLKKNQSVSLNTEGFSLSLNSNCEVRDV